ncbi:MAG: radical SAM protein [Cyanobacteria bacterium SBLK]|nr:radical SAM protein [Cyanobacteria bacterium SBLK]
MSSMQTPTANLTFSTVYGPVNSWRYGRSLGLDPIGRVSTCSFDCIYCQLGAIENHTAKRDIYIPTEQILMELQHCAPWDVDMITLSGSGEPTLAANLEEIIEEVKKLTHRPILVLTNGTMLGESEVSRALGQCDRISVKLDGFATDTLRRVNRPVTGYDFNKIWQGILKFRQEYLGKFSIQTMVLTPWPKESLETYIELMRSLSPDEIQLNAPTRPKPIKRQLDGRGNHSSSERRPYETKQLKCVSPEIFEQIAGEIRDRTEIPVKYKSENKR